MDIINVQTSAIFTVCMLMIDLMATSSKSKTRQGKGSKGNYGYREYNLKMCLFEFAQWAHSFSIITYHHHLRQTQASALSPSAAISALSSSLSTVVPSSLPFALEDQIKRLPHVYISIFPIGTLIHACIYACIYACVLRTC